MSLERFVMDSGGFVDVLKSDGVRADLQDRADRVLQDAEAVLSVSNSDIDLIADTTVGKTRAGATVIGVPLRLEQAHRILGGSIDAAR